jgi:predicted permease
VLSDLAWRGKYAANPRILGKNIEVLGATYEVVGIARPEFTGLAQVPPDFWIPLITTGPSALEIGRMVGRLKPGMSPEQAQAALAVWARRATADLPESERSTGVYLRSAATSIHITEPGFLTSVAPIAIAFGLVLLIACANVANMMLARAMARQREIGVRLSLGAGRGRLVRQLLTESLLLSLPSAAAGILVSQAAIRATPALLLRTAPSIWRQIFRLVPLETDVRVFLFVFAAAVVSTLLFGLAPAIQATRPGLMYATRGDFSADVRPSRLRSALVAGQITVCVLLLICSGILLRTGLKLQASDVRMTTDGVVDIQFDDHISAKLADRLQQKPGVDSIAAAWRPPLTGSLRTIPVLLDVHAALRRVGYNFVAPEYFNVFRVPVLRGRNFTPEESASEAPVAIVSEATATRLWPGENPLGQTLRLEPNPKADSWNKLPAFRAARVIGVAGDVISGVLGDGVDATCVYFPTGPQGPKNFSLLVRVKTDPDVARRALDADIAGIANSGVSVVVPMSEVLAAQIYPFRASSWIAMALGGLALALSLSGIYGVLSYLVSQRTKEIGIRIALGASTASVVRIVLSQSMKLAFFGIAIGAGLALVLSTLFASQLQNVNTFDLPAYFGSIAIALIAALAAAYVPSRRAASVDPMTALRCD